MSAEPVPHFTHEEFLKREVQSAFRHEFLDGRIEMMAGGSHNHSLLMSTIARILGNALDGRDCEVHGEALMVHIAAANVTTYPDAMVICGKPNFVTKQKNEVSNPVVIVEVLSPSSERYDRGEKFRFYQQLPSLKAYVLISQKEPLVEVYTRSDSGAWPKTEFRGLDAVATLSSLGIELSMKQLYQRVDWEV
jgi:Uma2 family endonuclease